MTSERLGSILDAVRDLSDAIDAATVSDRDTYELLELGIEAATEAMTSDGEEQKKAVGESLVFLLAAFVKEDDE